MSLVKYAQFQVLAAGYDRMPALPGESFRKTAHRWEPKYEPKPGYLYVRSRAISSRTNDNFDTFPAEEIEAAWQTFIGKPVFVNHHNSNHRRARGVIVDATLHRDVAPDGSPDTWVEVLMEVDAIRFPKLAEGVIKGRINRTSMGCSVAQSICSFCGNVAEDVSQFCRHIPAMKGQRITRVKPDGTREAVLVHEICRKISFFENSLLVEPPADPTAFVLGVDQTGLAHEPATAHLVKAANREADAAFREALALGSRTAPFDATFREVTAMHKTASLDQAFAEVIDNAKVRDMDRMSSRRTATLDDAFREVTAAALGACRAYQCGCTAYEPGPKVGQYTTCANCSHSENIHQEPSGAAPKAKRARLSPQEVARVSASLSGRYLLAVEDWGSPSHAIDYTEYDEASEIVPLCGTQAHLTPTNPSDDSAWVEGPTDVSCPACQQALASVTGSLHTALPKTETCKYCEQQATKRVLWAEGMAYVPVCDSHEAKARETVGEDEVSGVQPIEAALHTAFPSRLPDGRRRGPLGRRMVGTAEEMGLDPEGGKWVVTCEDHGTVVNVDTRAQALATSTMEFCDECAGNDLEKWFGASLHTGLGEQKAPAQVDTLRDDSCPVCGTTDYRGETCNSCGYVKTPVMFQDPNTEKVQELREDSEKRPLDIDLACDNCGMVFPAQSPDTTTPVQATAASKPAWLEEDDEEDDQIPDEEIEDDPEDEVEEIPGQEDAEEEPEGPAFPDPPEIPDPDGLAAETEQAAPDEHIPAEGDICPNCGEGTLLPKDEVPGVEQEPESDSGEQDPEATDAEGAPEEDDGAYQKEDSTVPDEKNQRPRNVAAAQRQALHARLGQQQRVITAQARQIETQGQALRHQAEQISALREVVAALAIQTGFGAHPKVARVFATRAEMEAARKVAATRRRVADMTEKNEPTNLESDQAAAAPAATDDVESEGAAPAAANAEVTPAGTTDVQSTEVTVDQPPLNDLTDVTEEHEVTPPAPGDSHVPTEERKVENPDTRTSDEASGVQWTSSRDSRFVAALRLARLRKAAGVENGDDIVMAQAIADSDMADSVIQHEITTLAKVAQQRQASTPAAPPRGLVPRAASGQRTTPSVAARVTASAPESSGSGEDLIADSIY